MSDNRFFGTYADFKTVSKKESAVLLGADNIVGDVFDIEMRRDEEKHTIVAWMVNRWGHAIGYFDKDVSRELNLCAARGWKLHALLSFVAFTDRPDPGYYWGSAAIVCYDPFYEEVMTAWMRTIGNVLAEGLRPNMELNESSVDEIITSKGKWRPQKMIPLPERSKGTVIMKNTRTFSENIIEKGRNKNVGCYVVSILFLVAIAAGVVFAGGKLFGLF